MLRVRVLGALEVRADGREIEPPASRRAWSLLAWLAVHPGEHPRGAVASVFWPDVLDTSARASLRSAAWALRRALGPGGEHALVATRDRLGLRCETDLREFDALVDAGDLEAAAALAEGPLLADLDDDWVLELRDAHTARLGDVLARLADAAPTPEAAIGYARRRLALDPLDEAAARDLMTRLAEAGDRAGALSVHDRLSERLRTQLGIAPSAQTREAVARVRALGGPTRADGPGAGAPGPPDVPPLVGRDRELGALLGAWAAPSGTLAVLHGEPGIGKTRLARELLCRARADGARTAACASLELGGPAPFSLWAELLRDLAATLPAPSPAAAWPEELAVIAPSLPLRLGRRPDERPATVRAPAELARARLFEAAVDAIEHACADRPLLLLFEDVHVADAASLELLAYVARRVAGLPVLAALTRRGVPERPEVDALVHAHRSRGAPLVELELGPLPREAVDALVRSVASLERAVREQIVEAAEGNALLAVEQARAAAGGHGGPPPTLQGAVRAALGRLPGEARRATELAAVAGRELTAPELTALTTGDAVEAALDSGLVAAEGGRFGFRHALLRDAALAHLPDARRRALHEQLAHALAGPAAEAARHLRLAGRDDLAADRLAGAAHEALRAGAGAEAVAFLEEALSLRPGAPELLLDLAEAHAWHGRKGDAAAALDAALEAIDPGDHQALAAAHVRAANWYSGALCWPHRAATEARSALAELEAAGDAGSDPRLTAHALAAAAWGESLVGDPDEAAALLHRLEALEVDDPDVRFAAGEAAVLLAVRDERLDDALALFRPVGERVGASVDRLYGLWSHATCIASALGRFDEALEHVERGLREVRRVPPIAVPMYALKAMVLAKLGRLGEARAALADERRAAERGGTDALLALADHDEGMFAAATGDHERAVALLGRALERGAAVNRPLARLQRAESLARTGAADEAEAELRAVTSEPVVPGDHPQVLVARMAHAQGLVAAARGDRDLARRRLDEAAGTWRRSLARVSAGGELIVSLVDLGRPTVGVVEPAREIERIEAELHELTAFAT